MTTNTAVLGMLVATSLDALNRASGVAEAKASLPKVNPKREAQRILRMSQVNLHNKMFGQAPKAQCNNAKPTHHHITQPYRAKK